MEMKKKITIIGLFSILICIIIIGCGKQTNTKDIFEKLYYAPTREEVLKEFGEPDKTYENDGEAWEDVFDNIEFMGEKGKLYVYYRGRGYIVNAKFEVLFPSSDASNKQVANKYAESISNFYTKKYGDVDEKEYWHATNSDKLYLYNLIDWNGDNFEVSINLN